MDILLNNAHSSLMTITLITLFLLFIKNKLINIIFALSQKTNTVYDELILFSIKTPSTYLIIFGYIFVIADYFNKNEYLDKLNSHNFHPRNINLPCLHELTYNKGDVNTYRKATEVVGRQIKE